MNTPDLLTELRQRGVKLQAAGNRLRYCSQEAVPPELLALLQEHKEELLRLLQEVQDAGAPPGSLPGDAATHEGARQLQALGWLPLWAEALGEPIILARNEEAARKAPKAYPVYTVEEMRTLAGLAPDELRAIHQARKLFGGKIRGAPAPAGNQAR